VVEKAKSKPKYLFPLYFPSLEERRKKDLLTFRGVIANKQTTINIPTTLSISSFYFKQAYVWLFSLFIIRYIYKHT